MTLRLKNTSREALFVDEAEGRGGLRVQRNVAGGWFSFVEQPRCPCQACEQICQGCPCDGGTATPLLRKVPAGETFERQWSGLVQVNQVASCRRIIGGSPCLRSEVAPSDERFRLELCHSPSAPDFQVIDGGLLAPGVLPSQSLSCVYREFRPMDGVAEVSPERGADCAGHADCIKKDELCFGGACTTACPAHGLPEIGAAWQLRVGEPEDQGFFTRSVGADGAVDYSGVGKVSSVVYQNGTMTVRLARTGAAGETLGGTLYLTLPPGYASPLSQGLTVSVRVLDASTSASFDQRALVMRELDGGLVIAADTAQLSPLLGPAETAPFTVASGSSPVACQHQDCGKRLYYTTTFAGGTAPVELEPGKSEAELAGGARYLLLNVANFSYRSGNCRPSALMPYAILREQGG
ncbi:MAG: hypothetical protein HYZ28_23365 [Myxococcales bacterium]|nr:hypothetical protein [Myxococcales bacterium]